MVVQFQQEDSQFLSFEQDSEPLPPRPIISEVIQEEERDDEIAQPQQEVNALIVMEDYFERIEATSTTLDKPR